MTKVSSLSIELSAQSDRFDQKVNGARRSVKKWGDQAKRAQKENKKLSDSFGRAANSVAIIDGPLGAVAGRLSSLASGFNAVGVAGTTMGVALAGAGAVMYSGLKVYAESERQFYRMEALLKATGNASGFTAKQLDTQARSVALATLASTEGIRDAQAVLLTFKTVSGDVFKRAISLSQDMASVMNSDAKSAVLQLGKALENPAKGLSALTRAGVTFTDAEQQKIKALQESGQLIAAQEILLDKVAGQMGGAATEEAKGLAGAVDTLSHRFSDFVEALAKFSGAGDGAQSFLNRMSRGLENATDMMKPDDVEDVFAKRLELVMQLSEAQSELKKMGYDDELQMNLISNLEEQIKKYDVLLQKQIGGQDQLIESERKAYQAGEDKRKQTEKELSKQKKLKEQEKQRLKLQKEALATQKESIRLANARINKENSLYQKLFGKKEAASAGSVGSFGFAPGVAKEKQYADNANFNLSAQAAKREIGYGSKSGAAYHIGQAEASYKAAKTYGWASGYDLEGMRDVVIALREMAGLEFKNPDQPRVAAAVEESVGVQRSILDIERHNGEKIVSLLADTPGKMAEKVKEFVGGYSDAAKQVNGQSSPGKKYVLELRLPERGNQKITLTGEHKDALQENVADFLEGAAAGI